MLAADERFTVSPAPVRQGFYRNFERCLRLVPATFPYVAFADQDDHWYPEKLSVLAAEINEPVVLAYSDARIVDGTGAVLAETYWQGRQPNRGDLASLALTNSVTGAAALFGLVGIPGFVLGALLLCSTLAVNLIERQREIGVLRTLGAKPARIFRLFLAEGLSIAVTGTLIGALAAIPLTLLMTGAAESRLLFVTVTSTVSINGLIMLGIGLLLTCLSIMLVLRAGLRRSVTEVLRSE